MRTAEGIAIASMATFDRPVRRSWLIRKLQGAGITRTDINKPDPKPEVPEPGELGWLLGLYSGVVGRIGPSTENRKRSPRLTHM